MNTNSCFWAVSASVTKGWCSRIRKRLTFRKTFRHCCNRYVIFARGIGLAFGREKWKERER